MVNTILSSDDKHLEIFSLIWLDIDSRENRNIERKLRSIINDIKKFEDAQQCQEYIEQTSENDRLVLLLNGQLEEEIIPSINQLRQVISIYVYCLDKQANEEWSSEFSKVKYLVTNLDKLVHRISEDYKIQNKLEEPLPINIFSVGNKFQFVFFQALIDCLLRLKSNETDKNELIQMYEHEYRANPDELNLIREFKEKYSSDKVLWWYSRESFFYRTLNAALRKQDIHMMFLLRPYISDIIKKLKENQSKTVVKAYRSQVISNDELKIMKQSIGQFISINSFFSISTNYSQTLSFLDSFDSSDDLSKVLFEINAAPKMIITKPFADISEYSHESEVLFMLGSIFRLENIFCNDNQIWIIQMSLCSENENELKQVLTYKNQQNGDDETNLRILGEILWEMGKLDLAEKYFIRSLKQFAFNDPVLGDLYKDLGKLAFQAGDFDTSMQWRRKALELKKSNQAINEPFQENIIHPNGMIRYGSLFGNRDGGSVFNDKIELNLSSMTCCVGVEVFWKPYLSAIRFIYESDDTSTRIVYHGNNGNQPQLSHPLLSEKFMLSTNERISKVTMYIGSGEKSGKYKFIVNDDNDKLISYIRGIRFYTTNGRRSCLYGVDDEDEFSESYEDYTVGYVRGRSGLLIDTFQFVWYQQSK